MAIADAWMTWAARPEELPIPIGLKRIERPENPVERARRESLSHDGTFEWIGADDGNDAPHVFRRVFEPTVGAEATEENSGTTCTGAAEVDPSDVHHTGAQSTASRRRIRPSHRVLGILAATGVATGGMLAAPGCETIVPIAVHAAISACIEVIKSLFDAPAETLPEGYVACESFEWQIEGHTLKFCVFCNPSTRSEVFLQFDCTGKYYPMRLRRIDRAALPEAAEGISIESIKCRERFLIDVESTIAPFMSGMTCSMRVPNHRMLPSPAHYGTLDIRIDGAPATRDADFSVDAGSVIELDGSFDEVTHYAMTCGVLELSFKDGQDLWTVHSNPEVSAIAVFRNDQLYDARFLFAPLPPGGVGH